MASNDERRLEDLKAGNRTLELTAGRLGAQLTEGGIIGLQVKSIIKVLTDEDPARDLAFNIAYQEGLRDALEKTIEELKKPTLHLPGNGK